MGHQGRSQKGHWAKRSGREKVAYASEEEARAAARLLRRPGYDLRAYRCPYCPAWHIGRWSWRRAPRLSWVQRIEIGERAAYWAEHPTRIRWPARDDEEEATDDRGPTIVTG